MSDVKDASRAIEVLESLRLHDSVSSIEERVGGLELDVTRLASARDEDVRRVASEMAVMRARVDDAVGAVHDTEVTMRAAEPTVVAAPSEELINGIIAGVGDAMTSLQGVTDARLTEVREAVERIASAVGSLIERIELLEERS